jgi:hypothetical protein
VPAWLAIEDTLQPARLVGRARGAAGEAPGLGPERADGAAGGDALGRRHPQGHRGRAHVDWTGKLGFAGKTDLLATFLAAAKLPASAVTFDAAADVDASLPGKERVVAAGDRIALLTDQFAFVQLPVARAPTC